MRFGGIVQLLLSVTVLQLTAKAQDDALRSIRKIYAAYSTTHTIGFSGTMKMYSKNEPDKIIERMSASYLLNGANFKYSIGPVEMLLNSRYYVSVDKSVRVLIVGNKKDLTATMQSPVLNIDQIAKWITNKDVNATVLRQGNLAVLDLKDSKRISGYDHYRIVYDYETGFMQKVLLDLSDENDAFHKTMVLEISYTRPLMHKQDGDVFSEKQFFTIRQNKIEVKSDYKGYQLINQL